MTNQRTSFVSTRNRSRAMAGGGTWNRNQNLVAFTPLAKLGPVSHAVLIIVLVAFLGLFYLTQLTKTGSFGYELNDVNQTRTDLIAEQDDLKIENARLQSLAAVQNSAMAANMTNPVSTSYAE